MIRILVVDDDSGHRLILKNRLTEKGSEVVAADSGAKGLVEARGGAFDAILVAADLGTGIDGFEVCRRLKSIPETNATPVVLFHTQSNPGEQVERGYDAGCDAFVLGQELNGLDHVVRLLVRQRRQYVELAEQFRGLHDQSRRSGGDRLRESENGALGSAEHQAVLRELASGRPDGTLLVDGEGTVRHADRGACELLGARLEGRHLGSLVPASGLEAFVRDARIEAREGFRFEVNLRRGRAPRQLTAVVIPLVVMPGEHDHGMKIVLFQDAAKRRLAADVLRLGERTIPRQELGVLQDAAREMFRPERIVGDAPLTRALREAVVQASHASGPVLVLGARGTGHERIARTLHFAGSATGAFLHLRCGALSAPQIDLELFGYVKGAFPGAHVDRLGLFQLAQDGTVFLEEVGALPLETQARLLRFLQEGTVQRLGAHKADRLDVRLLASSTVALETLVQQKKLLPGFAERIAETVIHVPTLRETAEDIVAIAHACLQRWGAARDVREISDEALAILRQHEWPGNHSELEDALEQACARANGGVVRREDLPRGLRDRHGDLPARDLIPARRPAGAPALGTHSVGSAQPVPSVPQHLRAAAHEARAWDISDEDPVSLDLYEKKALLRALDEVGGDKLAAARLLKVGKSTLYRKLKRFGIR